jgi:hypothetical protein
VSTGTNTTVQGPAILKSLTLTSGSWLLIGNTTFPGDTINYAGLCITTLLSFDKDSCTVMMFSIGDPTLNVTKAITITSTQTYNLVAVAGNIITASIVNFYAMRIG